MKFLDGRKTYISAIVLFAIGGAFYAGVIDQKTAETLAMIFGATGIASLRQAVNK